MTEKGEPLMSFGVMGGQHQPQGHVQMMIRIFEYRQNPQAAIDAPRWRVKEGLKVSVQQEFNKETIKGLTELEHIISKDFFTGFGGAQIIYKLDDGYLAASEPRKDGQAVGF